MGIHKSLAIGNDGEQFIKTVLSNCGIEAEKNLDKETRAEYDLACKFGKTKFTCEVKFDVKAVETGNLALEVHNTKSNKPSGLTATKANIWAHIILDGDNKTAWVASVTKLREFVNNNPPLRVIKYGGDRNAELYLYNLDFILEKAFTRIDMLDEKELKKVLKRELK